LNQKLTLIAKVSARNEMNLRANRPIKGQTAQSCL
jgi:hypothetical protein